MFSTSNLDLKSSALSGNTQRVSAGRITQFNHSLDPVFSDLSSYFVAAQYWNDLTHAERIITESKWTESILKLLSIGNKKVMHSLRYRLREAVPEEYDRAEVW